MIKGLNARGWLVAILLILATPTEAKEGSIWVAVRIQDSVHTISEYQGRMDRKLFWDIVSNKQQKGIFRLESVSWVDQKGIRTPLKDIAANGSRYGYGSDAFFAIEHIYRMIPLDPDFVQKGMNKQTTASSGVKIVNTLQGLVNTAE